MWNPWALLEALVTPFNHVALAVVLVPAAWRSRGKRKGFLPFFVAIGIALGACEVAVTPIVYLDTWLMHKAGGPSVDITKLLQVYLILVGPIMTVLGGLIAARTNAVEENQAVREEADIAKTRLLQSQLHPHVLFNALNGLAELIHKDPPTAERSVMHLADLLRRILRASEVATFSLTEERALLEDYLVIEGLRLGNRLRLRWDWDVSLDRVQVPPLLLQPLVENAIKHGITPSVEGGEVMVRARLANGELTLAVWNSGAPYVPGRVAGVGLANLEARLKLRYGSSGQFSIGPSAQGTLAAIKVQGVLLE